MGAGRPLRQMKHEFDCSSVFQLPTGYVRLQEIDMYSRHARTDGMPNPIIAPGDCSWH